MRRIFGGIPLSSTSTSLASDASGALPSPTGSTFAQDHSSSDAAAAPAANKGWFGSLTSVASSASNANRHSRNSSLPANSRPSEEDDDFVKLPFGAARMQSPPPSRSGHNINSPARGHRRIGSESVGQRSSIMSNASDQVGEPEKEREQIMVDLLSGQAIVEAKNYEILDWEEMQEIKKEHAVLATKLASLTRSLTLETKLRDSAQTLVRLSAPATRASAEAQLATATNKVDALTTEVHRLGYEESAKRAKLLKHTAGVLALAIRRKEEEGFGRAISPLPNSAAGERITPSPSPDPSQTRFEGHHFFAGNSEAIIPTRRTLGSPYASPQLAPPTSGAFPMPPSNAAELRELETQVTDLRLALEARERDAQDEAGRSRREIDDLRDEVSRGRDAYDDLTNELNDFKQEADDLRRELEDTRHNAGKGDLDLEDAKREAEEAQKKAETAAMDLEEAIDRAVRAEERISTLERQVRDGREERRRLEEANSRFEDDARNQEDRSGNDEALRNQLEDKENEQRQLVQTIGDVLRRHRTRPAVGSVLRDLPAFNDSPSDTDDLSSYISSSLDAHFDKLSNHVSQLDLDREIAISEKEGLEDDLRTAEEHKERLQEEIETHKRAKETAEDDLAGLRDRLGGSEKTEKDLASAQVEHSKLKDEITALEGRIAALEGELAETESSHASSLKTLQDLWRTIPPLDTRTAASGSDDLSVLKSAFEVQRRPMGNFLADVTSGGKFTIESLSERIRILLAEDVKLVNKLIAFEDEKDTHRSAKDAAEKKLQETLSSSITMQKQLKDMEERVEVSANKEVSMLERLNDLTESVEQARGEKRKAEAQLATIQAQLREAEEERSKLSASLASAESEVTRLSSRPDDSERVAELEAEIADLQDMQSDLQEELDDAKKREQKQRSQLLEQLSTAEQEVSSLKTQLRQAARRKDKA
ncbi:involucrin repeat protein [Pseudohyphozyma bogoriensis]|nr:involucrin repeat protein [Pseudohyphozyma bogoriensis]